MVKITIEESGNGTFVDTWCKIDGDDFMPGVETSRQIDDDFEYDATQHACGSAFESALAFESVFHYAVCYGDTGHDCLSDLMTLAEACIVLEHSPEATVHDDRAWELDLFVLRHPGPDRAPNGKTIWL